MSFVDDLIEQHLGLASLNALIEGRERLALVANSAKSLAKFDQSPLAEAYLKTVSETANAQKYVDETLAPHRMSLETAALKFATLTKPVSLEMEELAAARERLLPVGAQQLFLKLAEEQRKIDDARRNELIAICCGTKLALGTSQSDFLGPLANLNAVSNRMGVANLADQFDAVSGQVKALDSSFGLRQKTEPIPNALRLLQTQFDAHKAALMEPIRQQLEAKGRLEEIYKRFEQSHLLKYLPDRPQTAQEAYDRYIAPHLASQIDMLTSVDDSLAFLRGINETIKQSEIQRLVSERLAFDCSPIEIRQKIPKTKRRQRVTKTNSLVKRVREVVPPKLEKHIVGKSATAFACIDAAMSELEVLGVGHASTHVFFQTDSGRFPVVSAESVDHENDLVTIQIGGGQEKVLCSKGAVSVEITYFAVS
jgi:hypothetical protein